MEPIANGLVVSGGRLVPVRLGIGMAVTIKGFGPADSGFTRKGRLVSLPPARPTVFVVVMIFPFVYTPFGGDAWGCPTEGGVIGAFVVVLKALIRGIRSAELMDMHPQTAIM